MSRTLRALLILVLVAGCGGGSGKFSPPRNLNDACSILRERPNFRRAFKRAQRRWNVPISVQMATIYQESKFVGNARTPHRYVLGVIPMGRQSSAYGYSQALDSTWEEYRRDAGRRRAKRDNIRDATDFMGWYMARTKNKAGVKLTDARNQYLAYHEGQVGYLRGTYRSKAWLLRVADRVEERARMYKRQLRRCR